MPGRRFPRHSVRWFAALALLGLAAAGFAPWSFSAASLRRQLGTQIERETGLALTSAGRVTFALLPSPRIKIEAVALRSAAGDVSLDAPVLQGNLRLLPLLGGRAEFVAATL